MALDVSGLSVWTDEHKLEIISAAVLEGRTVKMINLQTGIKGIASINILDVAAELQAGGACGWNASGDTVLTQRDITVCDLKINEENCPDTLEKYYTSKMMKDGSYNEELPFADLYSKDLVAKVNSNIESIAWKGDTDNGSGFLSLCDGFLALFVDASASTVNLTGMTVTPSTIIDSVDAMVAAIPEDAIDSDDLVIFMSYANYRTYAKALRDANLFHYDGAENQGEDFSQPVPGTNVRAVAVKGLSGLDNLVLAELKNLYFGTDLEGDVEDFKLFFSEDNDTVRTKMKFKIGFQVAFPERIVRSI